MVALLLASLGSGCSPAASAPEARVVSSPPKHRIIVLVWDGLRPDSINEVDTPNLAKLRSAGVEFARQHAIYPSVTMMNAASFATGAFPDRSGFFGNVIYRPGAPGKSATGDTVDFRAPVFTEDYAILETLDSREQGGLLLTDSLFEAAQRSGLKTAAVGKSGPAFLQDHRKGGILLDERMAWPQKFAEHLQAAGFALPATAPAALDQQVLLARDNGDPTRPRAKRKLADGVTGDPTDDHGSPFVDANDYLMKAYVDYVLPVEKPDLSWVWLRNPDSTEHWYGPGTPNYRSALHSQDDYLARLQKKLESLGWAGSTDIVVLSDHGHSTVAGSVSKFPLRGAPFGSPEALDPGAPNPRGYSVSGEVRLAEELTRAGFKAFDGGGCLYSPLLSGVRSDGSSLHPTAVDVDGSRCGQPGERYTFGQRRVPQNLPAGAVVVASNGGSDYLYVPDRDKSVVRRAVRFLQSREELGPVFVSDRYGELPGTLPLSTIHLQSGVDRNPDVVVSYHFDEDAVVSGMPGTEYAGVARESNRGTHGSFSPRDVHNTLIAYGPSFRVRFKDELPTANVDVAPTLAHLLGTTMPGAEGRVLEEALVGGPDQSAFMVGEKTEMPGLPARVVSKGGRAGSFTFELHETSVEIGQSRWEYFDYAKEVRNPGPK
jgi:arylsulfatase A-like enzyme